jgi:archaellum component FlaC
MEPHKIDQENSRRRVEFENRKRVLEKKADQEKKRIEELTAVKNELEKIKAQHDDLMTRYTDISRQLRLLR